MNELELKAKRILDSINDFSDSYTYIEYGGAMLRIGINKEVVNIRALSLLYDLIEERISNVVWGDIERCDKGMCVNIILGQHEN